jgi:hypothetical protein
MWIGTEARKSKKYKWDFPCSLFVVQDAATLSANTGRMRPPTERDREKMDAEKGKGGSILCSERSSFNEGDINVWASSKLFSRLGERET